MSSSKDFRDSLKEMPLEELNYMLSRYCGPHNLLIRIKKFKNLSSSELSRMIYDEIASREMHSLLSADDMD